MTAGLGVAGALLLKKLVWDHNMVQAWVSNTWIPYQNPVKSALHKLTFRNEEKWLQWFGERSQFKDIYDRIEKKKGDKFNQEMTKGLMDYVETAPSLEEINLFIEKKPSIFDKLLPIGSKTRELWSSILSKLEKPLTKIKYYPEAVDKAYETLKKDDDLVDKLTKNVLGVLKPGFYRAMMNENVSTLIDEYLNIGHNKEQVQENREAALINAAMLQWAANMPYNVETTLNDLITSMKNDGELTKKFSSAEDSEALVKNALITFPTEKSIVNWLYQCPVFGEDRTTGMLPYPLKQRQESISNSILNVPNWRQKSKLAETSRDNIFASICSMIKGDISTKPAYRSLKNDIEKINVEYKKNIDKAKQN